MKKTLTIAVLLLTSYCFSQSTTYSKSSAYKKKQYTGTRINYQDLIVYFGIDTIADPYGNYWESPTNLNIAYIQPSIDDYFLQDIIGTIGKPSLSNLVATFTNDIDSSYIGKNFVPYSIFTPQINSKIDTANTYSKSQANAKYLHSFTETDPVWNSEKSNYYNKTQSDLRYLQMEVDGSTSNEIQTLSISGNTVSLSVGGGSVSIPTHTLTALTASTGISVTSGSVITNTAPMVTQTITGANGLTVESSVNTFTISKSKRQETYSGTTSGSGTYSVTFSAAYSVAPNIQMSITNQSVTNQYARVSSISTTGFTINVYSYSTNSLLGIISLISSTTNINGASVDVLITEK